MRPTIGPTVGPQARRAVTMPHERLVQMPTPLRIAAHVRYPLLSDLCSKHRAEPVPPKPDRLMADVDPALGQEILDVAQRKRVLHVHHHDQTDHFWRAVEISERVTHGLKLPQPKTSQKIALTVPGPQAVRPHARAPSGQASARDASARARARR